MRNRFDTAWTQMAWGTGGCQRSVIRSITGARSSSYYLVPRPSSFALRCSESNDVCEGVFDATKVTNAGSKEHGRGQCRVGELRPWDWLAQRGRAEATD